MSRPFASAILDVDPATRQLKCGAIAAKPSNLASCRCWSPYSGPVSIVTRDELVERCWDGRVVGDDAINRVLSRMRHIAADFGRAASRSRPSPRSDTGSTVAGDGSADSRTPRPSQPSLARAVAGRWWPDWQSPAPLRRLAGSRRGNLLEVSSGTPETSERALRASADAARFRIASRQPPSNRLSAGSGSDRAGIWRSLGRARLCIPGCTSR